MEDLGLQTGLQNSVLAGQQGVPKDGSDELSARAARLESLGLLASGIAHDLNNVLSPIVLAAPILREHATDPDDVQIIASLEKSAARGIDLVRQILTFAKGTASVPHLVDLKKLLNETVGVASASFPKSIRVVGDFPSNLWPIVADPTQIYQMLLNLCVNARDAMPGGGTLYLMAENSLLDEATARRVEGGRPGAWIVFHVEDSGTGIPHDALARIWQPFFSTKEAGKGMGLGLSTVRRIVENHKGFISLKTFEGRGTTFRVYLPAAEAPGNGKEAAAPAPGKHGNGELILVVDDEPLIRDFASAILARNGYRTLAASDGSEAVALFSAQSSEIKLVITDLVMPNLGGVALADIALRLNPGVKILAISGVSSAGRNGKIERFGGSILFKPFKVQALLEAVGNLLRPPPVAEVA